MTNRKLSLNINQINNLCTGVVLATELKSKNPELRKFLIVEAYSYNSNNEIIRMDKFVKEEKLNNIYFEIICYEMLIGYENYFWDTDYYLKNKFCKNNIKGIEQLKIELGDYIQDYSILKPEWYCEDLPYL